MNSICAWCGAPLERAGRDEENLISHGICAYCREKFFGDIGAEPDLFLDTLSVPVLTIDGGVFSYANTAARDLLGKELPEIKGATRGEAFECVNARLPGGCGNTGHCTGCILRLTIMETYNTGKGRERVPVVLNRVEDGRSDAVEVLITTEKINNTVLLRIDQLSPLEDFKHVDETSD